MRCLRFITTTIAFSVAMLILVSCTSNNADSVPSVELVEPLVKSSGEPTAPMSSECLSETQVADKHIIDHQTFTMKWHGDGEETLVETYRTESDTWKTFYKYCLVIHGEGEPETYILEDASLMLFRAIQIQILDEDKQKDALVLMYDTGWQGYAISIVTVREGALYFLPVPKSDKFSELSANTGNGFTFTGTFADSYKAIIFCPEANSTMIADIPLVSIDEDRYDEDGKLLRSADIDYCYIYDVSFNESNQEITIYQEIYGEFVTQHIGYTATTVKYVNGEYQIIIPPHIQQ